MKDTGFFFGKPVALPLYRADMDKYRALHGPHMLKNGNELLQVMPVNRTEIPEPEVLEEH